MFLHIKLVKYSQFENPAPVLAKGQICHSKSGKIRLRLDWKKINPVQPYTIPSLTFDIQWSDHQVGLLRCPVTQMV